MWPAGEAGMTRLGKMVAVLAAMLAMPLASAQVMTPLEAAQLEQAQVPPAPTQPTVLTPPPAPAPAPGPAPMGPPAAIEEAPRPQVDYVLGPGDRIRVIVFGEEQMSGEFQVNPQGGVAMPLINEVRAIGLTLRQFEDALEARLSDGYLVEPRVSVDVLNFRPFYIFGEVQQPQAYPYTNGLNVVNAIATAGGFTPNADQRRVFIWRAGAAQEEEVALSAAVEVKPGDTIRVAKAVFFILGEVTDPGEYPFSEGLTVINAVATAGGFTYRANQRVVFLKRRGEATEQRVRITPSLMIGPGDTLRIVERFF
jgi:polysaccharide export outer membrane protein